MCSSKTLLYIALSILTAMFIGCGTVGLYIAVPDVKDDVSTTCRVLNQTVKKESCATWCPDCMASEGGDGYGGYGCGDCSYVPYTCYVTWGYNLNGHLYTTQTSVCSRGGDVYDPNYVEQCWYDKKNPRNITFNSPVISWVVIGFAAAFIVTGLCIVICIAVHCRRNRNQNQNIRAEYDPI